MSAVKITKCVPKPSSISRGGEGAPESEVLRRLCQRALLLPPAFGNGIPLLMLIMIFILSHDTSVSGQC